MKKIFTNCVIVALLFFFNMNGRAQSDVTNLVLKNAGFDENVNFKVSDNLRLTTSNNNTGYDAYLMQPVSEWDLFFVTGANGCGAAYEYGSPSSINNVTPPATNPEGGTSGACLGLSAGWSAQVGYTQNVALLAGSYAISYAVYNRNISDNTGGTPGTQGTSLAGWLPSEGTSVLSSKTSFSPGVWETDGISFDLAANATGKIQVGLSTPNASSNSVAKIFIANLTLTCNYIDKTGLPALVDEANALYGDGSGTKAADLKAALDAYIAVAGEDGTSPALINAAISLSSAVKNYKDNVANEEAYANDMIELGNLLDEAEAFINGNTNGYSQAALNTLEAIFTTISNAYDEGLITMANIQDYLNQLRSAYGIAKASAPGMKIQYKFNNVTGNTVTNTATGASGVNYDGTLYNDASIIQMGAYKVLSLGNGAGYLDMGTNAGYVLPSAANFVVSVYYRVDKNATITADGNFLWSFATSSACSQSTGTYAAYRLNKQIFMLTNSGYGNEQSVSVVSPAAPAEQNGWHNLVYRQEGTSGKLYLDGALMNTNEALSIPSDVFTASSLYNWIGRSPFTSDVYLKNTLVYDFEFYNQQIPDQQIDTWAAEVPKLNDAYDYGSVGDFSQLAALIAEYKASLSGFPVGDGVGQYSQDAVDIFNAAMGVAQALVDDNRVSQFLIDDEIATLTAAYNTFLASVGSAAVYPASQGVTSYNFESGLYYIQIGDYYLTVPETGVENTYLQLRAYIDNPDKLNNNQVWNIRFNPIYSIMDSDPPAPLYSFVSDSVVWGDDGTWHMDELCRMKKGDTPTAQGDDASNWSWREHQIFFNGKAYCITGNQNGSGALSNALTFPAETLNEQATNASPSQKVFNVIFRTVDDVVANPATPPTGIQTPKVVENAKIYGGQGEIVVSGVNTGDKINVYDISGRLVRTINASCVENRCSVVRGLYIVRVSGQMPVVGKVIVQ